MISGQEEAVRYLDHANVPVPTDIGEDCLRILLDYENPTMHAIQDAVIAGLPSKPGS
jgi:hypothetical protein